MATVTEMGLIIVWVIFVPLVAQVPWFTRRVVQNAISVATRNAESVKDIEC
jgi:hypothetical protein